MENRFALVFETTRRQIVPAQSQVRAPVQSVCPSVVDTDELKISERIKGREPWIEAGAIVIATAAVVATISLAVRSTRGNASAYEALRTPDGKPNLNGIWQALNTANWDIQDHAAQPAPF